MKADDILLQHLVGYMDQLHQFLVTVGPKLMQEDKVAIYEAVAWVISSMPMEESASTLRKFAIEILSSIAAIVSQPTPPTSEETKSIQGMFESSACDYVLIAWFRWSRTAGTHARCGRRLW